jgi:hypothetical protein
MIHVSQKQINSLSIVMSKPLVSNQVEGDCAEHLFAFSQVSEEFLKTGAGKM